MIINVWDKFSPLIHTEVYVRPTISEISQKDRNQNQMPCDSLVRQYSPESPLFAGQVAAFCSAECYSWRRQMFNLHGPWHTEDSRQNTSPNTEKCHRNTHTHSLCVHIFKPENDPNIQKTNIHSSIHPIHESVFDQSHAHSPQPLQTRHGKHPWMRNATRKTSSGWDLRRTKPSV